MLVLVQEPGLAQLALESGQPQQRAWVRSIAGRVQVVQQLAVALVGLPEQVGLLRLQVELLPLQVELLCLQARQ